MTMISALFEQPVYAATKKLLDASVLRHEAIASNIANLERIDYKRLEVAPSFHNELRDALREGSVERLAGVQPQLRVDPQAQAPNRDGNTVRLEQELVDLGRNFVEHSMETQLISGSLLRLRLAITGRTG